MSEVATGYEFAPDLPVNLIAPGTTVIVAGPAFSPAEALAQSLVAEGTKRGEGALFISTNMTCDRLVTECQGAYPAVDTDRLGIIDCSGQNIGQSELAAEVKYVSTQSDLTGIGMKFSTLYEGLYPNVSSGRVRTGLISLSSLSMYVDLRTLFQFTQMLSGRIDSADGLGVFVMDPTAHDTKTVNTLSQAASGRIEVRDTEDETDGELRVMGLPDQPSDWQPFSLS